MKMNWDADCSTSVGDKVGLYVNKEGTVAWSKLVTADTVGDVSIGGRSLNDAVVKIDELESRIRGLECISSNIDMCQVNGLENTFYTVNVTTAELERSLRNLQESFRNLQCNINNYMKPDIVSNKLKIQALEERARSLDSNIGYINNKLNSHSKVIADLKKESEEKKGTGSFLDFPDYFEKMNFKNRATRLNKMELNYIMKGTM